MARRTARSSQQPQPRSWERSTDEFLFTAATNQPAPRIGDTGVRSLRSLVNRLGGKRAAAQQLGVSVRTVQRWTAQDVAARAKPGRAAQTAVQREQRRLRDQRMTQAATGRRAARMKTTGATLRVQGSGGLQQRSPAISIKPRPELPINLSGDEVGQLYSAMAQSEAAAMQFIGLMYDKHYMNDPRQAGDGDWTWESVDRLTLDEY